MPYSVVIVDDESYIANTTAMMLRMLREYELDIQIFHSATEANAWITHTKVDLLVSDVQMPHITGLELMQTALAYWPMCQVVLLTAYPEFDYVYEAIRYPQVSYVLKREGHEVLLEAVCKSLQRLDDMLAQAATLCYAQEQMERVLPLLQRELLMDLVHGAPYGDAQIDEAARQLQLPLDLAAPMALCLLLSRSGQTALPWQRSWQAGYAVPALRSHMPASFAHWPVQIDSHRALCVLQAKDKAPISARHVEGILESVQQTCEAKEMHLSAIYSTEVGSWRGLAEKYSQMRLLQASMATSETQMWLLCAENSRISQQTALMDSQHSTNARRWRHMFENGDTEEAEHFRALVAPLGGFSSVKNTVYTEMYMTIALQICAVLRGESRESLEMLNIDMPTLLSPIAHAAPDEALRFLLKVMDLVRAGRYQKATNSTRRVVGMVTDYVKNHLHEDISLTQLASHVGINASYLSRVFRRATGSTLLAYISTERMNLAYTLLAKESVLIQDISKALGFATPAYFSYFFKKNAGISPREWREQHAV